MIDLSKDHLFQITLELWTSEFKPSATPIPLYLAKKQSFDLRVSLHPGEVAEAYQIWVQARIDEFREGDGKVVLSFSNVIS